MVPWFGPYPTPTRAPGLIASAKTLNSTVWLQVAANAWAYFQPGVGVDTYTGLPYAEGADFVGFTDWDLGVYIQAIIDANNTGLIGNAGDWGSNARINTVLTFLKPAILTITAIHISSIML